jgi:hypothetical protein
MGEWRSWRSNPANNHFAPNFSVDIWFDLIGLQLTNDLLEVVKRNEDLYKNHQWEHYNIFLWEDRCIRDLKDIIKASYEDFCRKIGCSRESVWIRGWVYPQKQGMVLKRHSHAMHENAYISGNICLTENNTTTDYDIPYLGWVTTENSKGRMTLFPSCLPHSVDKLKDGERYTIAFDLITEQGMDYFWCNNKSECDPLLLAVEL